MAPPPEAPHEPASGDEPPPPGDPGPPGAAGELAARLDELTRQLAALTETARREHERAAHREQVIDRLHAENQQLRHGLLNEALTPVRAGLYRLYDTVAREAALWSGPRPPDAELAGRLLSAMADEVAEVLGRTGAERLAVEPGAPYDPLAHRPARTAAVEAGADGTVVEVLSDGFATGERVVRKAAVVVGRAENGDAPAGAPSHNPTKDQKNAKKRESLEDLRKQKDRKDDKDRTPRVATSDTPEERTDGGTDKESE